MIVLTFKLAFIIFLFLSPIVFFILKNNYNNDKGKLFFSMLLYFYFVCLTNYTIFPIDFLMASEFSQLVNFLNNINLIPIPFTNQLNIISKHIILNIIMSIPFGIIICLISKKRLTLKKTIFIGLFYGTAIEIIQLSIGICIKYLYRSIDINDIIFNTIGTIIGYLLFKYLISKIYLKLIENLDLDIKSSTILTYIKKICNYYHNC